jgi:hypothetical protein
MKRCHDVLPLIALIHTKNLLNVVMAIKNRNIKNKNKKHPPPCPQFQFCSDDKWKINLTWPNVKMLTNDITT